MGCYTGITQQEKETETCNGVYTKDTCIIHEAAIPELNLPVNSSIEDIVNAFVLAITYKEEQIQSLTERIEALENPE